MNGFYKQLIAILKQNGFRYIRQGKGDHEIWGNGKIERPVDRNSRSLQHRQFRTKTVRN